MGKRFDKLIEDIIEALEIKERAVALFAVAVNLLVCVQAFYVTNVSALILERAAELLNEHLPLPTSALQITDAAKEIIYITDVFFSVGLVILLLVSGRNSLDQLHAKLVFAFLYMIDVATSIFYYCLFFLAIFALTWGDSAIHLSNYSNSIKQFVVGFLFLAIAAYLWWTLVSSATMFVGRLLGDNRWNRDK